MFLLHLVEAGEASHATAQFASGSGIPNVPEVEVFLLVFNFFIHNQ